MKSHKQPSNLTPILIGFSLLLIGVAQITALMALSKILIPTVIESSAVEDLQPAKH